MRRAAFVVTIGALLVLACGRKAPPVAPELVRPEPPDNLSAISTPNGIRITWLRPLRYSGGAKMNDLGGFDIDRTPGEGVPADFKKIGTLPVTDQDRFRKERHMEWLDNDAAPGALYLYRVTAFTLDGYRSAPAGPVTVRFGSPGAEPPSSGSGPPPR